MFNNKDFVTSPARRGRRLRAARRGSAHPARLLRCRELHLRRPPQGRTGTISRPRIGFSYDLNADQRTVFFGGYGRYYDRALFRSAAEETLLTQYRSGELLFSSDGLPRDGRQTIHVESAISDARPALQALLASLAADPTSPGTSELRVIPNDLKTPYTDQFSLGIRQRFGIFRTSLSYQLHNRPATRSAMRR